MATMTAWIKQGSRRAPRVGHTVLEQSSTTSNAPSIEVPALKRPQKRQSLSCNKELSERDCRIVYNLERPRLCTSGIRNLGSGIWDQEGNLLTSVLGDRFLNAFRATLPDLLPASLAQIDDFEVLGNAILRRCGLHRRFQSRLEELLSLNPGHGRVVLCVYKH
jgi:hypothetical protein